MDAELTSNYAVVIFKVNFHLCKNFQHLGKHLEIRSFLSSDSQTCHQLRHKRGARAVCEKQRGCSPPQELPFGPGHVAANILNFQWWQWQRGFPLDPRWSSWHREAPQHGCCQIPCSNQWENSHNIGFAFYQGKPVVSQVLCFCNLSLQSGLSTFPAILRNLNKVLFPS